MTVKAASDTDLRLALSKLLADWIQQLRDHSEDAERFAHDPGLAVAYRDLCTKAAVYGRAISDLAKVLDPTTEFPACGCGDFCESCLFAPYISAEGTK